MTRPIAVALISIFCFLSYVSGQTTATAVHGGTARLLALGGSPQNFFVTDYSDLFINPARAGQFKDMVFGDLGYGFVGYRASGQFVGLNVGLGDYVIGLSVGKREGPMFSELTMGSGALSAVDNMVNGLNAFLATYGYGSANEPLAPIQLVIASMSGTMRWGAGLYVSRWAKADDGSGSVGAQQALDASTAQIGVKLGVLGEFFHGISSDVSILVRWNSASAKFTDGNANANPSERSYTAGCLDAGAFHRMQMDVGSHAKFITFQRISYGAYKPEESRTPAASPSNSNPNDYARLEWEVGAGVEKQFSSATLNVGASIRGLELSNKITATSGSGLMSTSYSKSWIDLPKIQLGFEMPLADWLVGRLGYFKSLTRVKTLVEPTGASPTQQTSYQEVGFLPSYGLSSADQQLSLGVGIAIKSFSLDGYVSERFLSQGPWFISGSGQEMFGVLSFSVTL